MTWTRYREIFRNRAFRRFWLGFSFSVLGDGMTRVALVWFVYAATGSARAVGLLMLCYTGPIIVGGLMAGMILDRFDRRRVMMIDNLIRGAVIAGIPLLHAFGALPLWYAYVAASIYGFLMMLSLAGGPSLVPSLVAPEQLGTANALEMLSFTLGGVVGPPLAGLLIGAIGAPNVIVVDVASYLFFALALGRIRLAPQSATAAVRRTAHIGHAVRLLLGNPVLRSTTIMFCAFNIGGGIVSVWLPVLADQSFGGGARLYGVLLGVLALGEVIASLLAGGITVPVPLGTMICCAQVASGAALLLVFGMHTVWGAALGLLLYGLASAPLTIWAQTLRMQIIPDDLRGRTFALLRTLMQSGAPIGGALGGVLLQLLGIPVMIALSAVIGGVPGLIGLRVPALRGADHRGGLSAPMAIPLETIEG